MEKALVKLEKCVQHYGGRAALAEILGTTPDAIKFWFFRRKIASDAQVMLMLIWDFEPRDFLKPEVSRGIVARARKNLSRR